MHDKANGLIDYIPGLDARTTPSEAAAHRVRQARAVLVLVRHAPRAQPVVDEALGAVEALLEQAECLAELPAGDGGS